MCLYLLDLALALVISIDLELLSSEIVSVYGVRLLYTSTEDHLELCVIDQCVAIDQIAEMTNAFPAENHTATALRRLHRPPKILLSIKKIYPKRRGPGRLH